MHRHISYAEVGFWVRRHPAAPDLCGLLGVELGTFCEVSGYSPAESTPVPTGFLEPPKLDDDGGLTGGCREGGRCQALDCPLEATTSMCPLQQLQAEGTAGFREQGMDFLRWRGAGMADPQGSSAAVRDR